ncbi:MAG: HNH endonuclease [Candidatus Sumerlaeaceae bacterium]|nr:HNH endonuclease [Candidatus Sumerlaeaceae bacterium]
MQTLLNESVLVLNRHWTAVHVTSVRRSLVLLYGGHARVVAEDFSVHDFGSWRELSAALQTIRAITTPSFRIAVPEVIMLTSFSKYPPRQVKFSRRNIYMRDNYTCQYCGCVPPRDELTVDHILPRSRGGRSTWDNVVLACMKCNMKKGDRLPHEIGMQLRTQPKKPHWLACSNFQIPTGGSSLWQKFLDNAYWNVPLLD